jgi:uncharacterized protein
MRELVSLFGGRREVATKRSIMVLTLGVASMLVLFAGVLGPAQADTLRDVVFPKEPDGVDNFIVDNARMMSASDFSQANAILKQLRTSERIPVFVATITSLSDHGAGGYSIERYAFELFSEWRIGAPDTNKGVLLLVSREDRLARIELGLDWGRSHDYQAQTIMDGQIIARFKTGQFSEGIIAGVRALDSMVRSSATPQPYVREPDGGLGATGILVILGVLALSAGIVVSLAQDGTDGWGWVALKFIGLVILFLVISGLSGGKKGGLAGGGGATGSW